MNKLNLVSMCTALTVMLSSAPVKLNAQDEEAYEGTLEEVVVTATRREENLQDVAISLTAFNSSQLEQLNIRSSQQIQLFTPGLSFATTAGEGQKANVVIRGVGLNTSSEVSEQNVGIYLDDVYITTSSGFSFNLYDIERVEVLRGPQGTLYGNTVTGGLIHYITRKPSQEADAYIKGSYGSFNDVQITVASGGGLTDTLAFRLAADYQKNDGWFKNTSGPDNNQTDSKSARAQLLWSPTSNADLLFRYRYSENDPSTGSTYKSTVAFLNPETGLGEALPSDQDFWGSCAGCDRAGNPGSIGDGPINEASRGVGMNGDLFVKRSGGGLKADFDLGFGVLTSVTDWDNVEKFFEESGVGGPLINVGQFSDTDSEQFQQELRLAGDASDGRLRWSVGGFYLTRDILSDFAVDFTISDFPAPPWLQVATTRRETRNWAALSRIEYDFSDKFSLVAGLRYTDQKSDTASYRTRFFTFGLVLHDRFIGTPPEGEDPTPYNVIPETVSFSGWSGKFELQYRPSDNSMWYFSYARGWRPGDFNNNAPGVDPLIFEETLDAFEIGSKYDFANAPVRLNTTFFYYNYNDLQTRAFLGLDSFLLNVQADSYGAEIELTAAPSEGLDLSLSGSFFEGKVKDLENGVTGIPRDTDIPNAPGIQLAGYIKKQWQLNNSGNVFGLLSGAYRGSQYAEVQNNPVQRSDSYILFNARAGYISPKGNWELGVNVDNILDEEYTTFIGFVTSIGIAQRFPGRPRWASIYFNYNFF